MAESRKLPSFEQWARDLDQTANSRPADSQGLDGGSSDPNLGGASSSAGREEQGEGVNNRGDGGRGTPQEGGGSGTGNPGLPIPPASLPPSIPPSGAPVFTTADNILKKIADRFNQAREEGKVQAWRQFQRDLMEASPYLVPIFIPYKDLVQLCADIEKEIKGSTVQAGKSNEEVLADFLNGGSSLEGVQIPGPPADYNAEAEIPLITPPITNPDELREDATS